jgi:hypothetical protein
MRDAEGRAVGARDEISTIALLGANGGIGLNACALMLKMTTAADGPDTQPLRIVIGEGAEALVVEDATINLGPPNSGIRGAIAEIPLDRVKIPFPGSHTIRIFNGEHEIGSKAIVASVLNDKAKARFGAFHQISQGISGSSRYLTAQLPFALFGNDGSFGGYGSATISQPEGGDFEQNPLDIELPASFARLHAAYGFTTAVHQAYDRFAKAMFGGSLPDGANVAMAYNTVEGEQVIEFTLPAVPDVKSSKAW